MEAVLPHAAEGVGKTEALMAFSRIVHAFDDVGIDLEAFRGEQRGEDARAHAVADMKRLTHRADVLAHAAARRCHDAHRHAGLQSIEAHHAAGGYGNSLPADDADGVPTVVEEPGSQSLGDARGYLEADGEGFQHRPS